MVQVSNIRSAEQLISFPSNSDPSNTVDHSCSDLYIYAKTLFDTKEYKRCSHILVNESDSLSKFLCIYAEYLHVESSTQYQTSIKRDGNTKAGRKKVHSDLLQLCTRLENIVDKDAFLLYLTGVLFNRLENSIKASQYLVEAINRNSLIWSAWQELGTTIGSPEDVEKILLEIKLPSGNLGLEMFKIHIMNELQQPPETVSATLDNMLQNLPKNLFLQLNRAILYHNSRGSIYSQDFEEAEQLFHQIHTENPYLVDSMDYYSNVLYVRREYSKLCELAHQSTLVNKYRPETCTIVGNYYSMKGERQKAIESFSRALKLDCNYSPAWTLLGHEYVDSCKPKQAIEVYRKAVDLNPKDYRAWYGLGQAYDLLSLPHYSIYYHQRAIAIRPNDGRMWSALSNSLESVGKFEQAISCLKRVLICSDEIETLDFARIAQLSKKLYDKNGDGMVLAQAADYYEKYLNEVHRTSEAEEFVDEANEFLQSFRKR